MTNERIMWCIQKAGWSSYEIQQHYYKLKRLVETVENRTLTNQKAKWYQEGRDSAIEECLSVVRKESQNHFDWDQKTEGVAFGIVAFKLTKHFGVKDD